MGPVEHVADNFGADAADTLRLGANSHDASHSDRFDVHPLQTADHHLLRSLSFLSLVGLRIEQGLQDELVPPRMMKSLHDAAKNSVERLLVTVHCGTHNSSWSEGGPAHQAVVCRFISFYSDGS